jgi:hypothetical protein
VVPAVSSRSGSSRGAPGDDDELSLILLSSIVGIAPGDVELSLMLSAMGNL